jgi:putative aldouronate transport system substrate-binding protein
MKIRKRGFIVKKSIVKVVAVALVLLIGSTVGLAAKQIPKPKQITAFLSDSFLLPQRGQTQFCEEYKKQTGIELKIVQPVKNQYYDKLRLAFASGDIPDVVEISDSDYVQYANEGAFVDLSKYVKTSKPFKNMPKTLLNSMRIKGKLYGIPIQMPTTTVTYIRKDWLHNLGLKAPTTWTEFYKVMKAFTQKDPDKNGKDDTYGITAPGVTSESTITFGDIYYSNFYQGASPGFIYRNGKWLDGFNQKEMKGVLTRLRQAYQENLIDPEIFTNKTSTCREKFTSGKAGIFTYWAGAWQVELETNLRSKFGEKAGIMPIAPIKGSQNLAHLPVMNAITVKAKNPEGIFKYFIEYSHDGGKGQMLFVHGVENVHWKKSGNKTVALPYLDNPNMLVLKAYHTPAGVLVPWLAGKDPIDMDKRIIESTKLSRANCRYDVLQVFTESRRKIEEALNNAKNDALMKAVTGEVSIDQALADYQKKYFELKVDQVLKEINRIKCQGSR